MKKRKSIIWTISDRELEIIVSESSFISEALRKLGFSVWTAYHYKAFKKRCEESGIDFSHIPIGLGSNKGRASFRRLTKEEALQRFCIKKEWQSNKSLIKYIKRFGFLDSVCSRCGGGEEWFGELLILQLDHINGNNLDDRLENLRFLCPNCHSQTETFSGRRLKKKHRCCECKAKVSKGSNICSGCNGKKNRRYNWPNEQDLRKLVWEKPTVQIAKSFGVNENTISSLCKKYSISKPPRGYWQKKKVGKI